jgi:hypothetical protein
MTADMADRQSTTQGFVAKLRGCHQLATDSGWGIDQSDPSISRGVGPTGQDVGRVQGDYIGDSHPGMLLGKSIIPVGQQSIVHGSHQVRDPGTVKGMKRPGIDPGPVMNGHEPILPV